FFRSAASGGGLEPLSASYSTCCRTGFPQMLPLFASLLFFLFSPFSLIRPPPEKSGGIFGIPEKFDIFVISK
ncbi:hypothetical protein, partial [Alistipes finegoldii]|uniref:hypothetical protein n=1 Tax=Alistipes finegoldii TaxID=214856 RepID=UPI003AB2CD1D